MKTGTQESRRAPLAASEHPGATRDPGTAPRFEVATVVVGVSLAVLVGLDGSPVAQLGRVVGVAAATVLLVRALARHAARWRGRLAVLVGAPSVAIAVGFAPHLVKGGPLPVRAAAGLLLVAGLALLICGVAAATRGRGRWRRAGAALVVAVATAVVAVVVSPAIAATNVPRPQVGDDPSSVGLAHHDVTLRTDDGVPLAAWYVDSSNRAAVVLLHGAGSTRSDVLDHAAVLAGAGFGVLMIDARGHGASGGRAMDFGWHGDADVTAATGYLAGRPDVTDGRIGVVGMSMGGEEAIGASAGNERISAVVAEGATARTAVDEAWLSDEYGVRGAVQEQLERLQDRTTDLLTSASVPTSLRAAVGASPDARYLLIAAGTEPDEEHAAKHVAAGAPDRVETWTVPAAAHTGGLATAPEEWTDRVVGFLDRVLLPR